MTAPFPHRYGVSLVGDPSGTCTLLAPPRSPISGGAPPEFDGRADVWSPEALLLASVSLCLETTFQALARRQELALLGWTSHCEGTVDKTPGGLAFTAILVEADVDVRREDAVRAEKLAGMVARHCLVSSSLKTPVTISVRVRPT
jgi:organic hydroperoxide reductase OsmC/OhrA